jgi:superoxide dismutase, Fe-Mn family
MFVLPQLGFEYSELEPHIDAKTMEIHYTKHHQGYVNKLNAALEGLTDFQDMSVEDLMKNLDKLPTDKLDAVRNNGGGHANHSLFWSVITPGGSELGADSKLLAQINEKFGSLENCIKAVSDKAATHFGSGWGWLVVNKNGELEALSTPNQNSPYTYGKTPILGIDVWEHAYYLNYQNRRPDYLAAFWNVANWAEVEKRYLEAVA